MQLISKKLNNDLSEIKPLPKKILGEMKTQKIPRNLMTTVSRYSYL